jgi:4-amino-4-deoxy-L-arabinose transferase-like glycosyltransferase
MAQPHRDDGTISRGDTMTTTLESPEVTAPASRRNFVVGITIIAVVALGVRVAWVLIARRNFALHGDDFFYHWQANALADGQGFLNPFTWKALGRIEPSAAHPPLYSMYLAVFSWFGFTTALAHRLASCLLGAAAVVVVGLVGRKIAGDRAGLVGAGIAAVYPQLWINDGMLVSESMYILMIAVTLLFAYRLWESRSKADAAWLGLMIGLSALTRPEAVFLVPLFGIPFLFTRNLALAKRFLTVLVMGGVCLAVIMPWWVRNLTVFDKPTFLATGNGIVLQVSNCDGTYSGQFLGYWDITCLTADAPPQNEQQREILKGTSVPGLAYLHARDPRDDSELDTEAREKAFDYIGDHLSRVPIVVAARVGRIWGVFRPRQEVNFDIFFERRGKWTSWAGAYMYYALLPFAIYALVVMRKRRVPISPMIAIFALVTITVAMAMGITRYRVGADVALAILGGVAVDALIRHFRRGPAGSLAADDGLQPA